MFHKVFLFCTIALSLTGAPFSFKLPGRPTNSDSMPKNCEPRAVLASAEPCWGSGDLFISASFLMWQSKLWGLEFATKSYIPNIGGSDAQTFEVKQFVPDFAWHPGFELQFGSHLPFDGWDFRVGWIYYKETFTNLKKHFDSVINPDGIGIIPLWHYPFLQIVGGNGGNPLRYGSATGDWKMTFNSVDLELGHYFFPHQAIPMRLKIGAKIAGIRQKYSANYENGMSVLAIAPQEINPTLFQFISSLFHAKSDQWSIGPRMGLESRWHMFYGVNLIGHGAFSILCSFFDIDSGYTDVIEPNLGTIEMEMKEHFRELTPVCEAMLGLDWGICFREAYYFGITIGYEWQYWWSVNHLRRNYVQTLPGETFDMRGELQMQGLNAALKLDF